jgi:plasmid maintenance system antidote protein VapI
LNGLDRDANEVRAEVSRPAPPSFLNVKADLSGQMALRIEKAFGVKMETLMRMQSSYDIACTRARAGSIRVRPYQLSA